MIAMQLRLEDLSASQAASAVQPLQDSIKSASSSVSIPNLVHQVRAPNPAVLFTQSPCRQYMGLYNLKQLVRLFYTGGWLCALPAGN